jgi:hypothetical protein
MCKAGKKFWRGCGVLNSQNSLGCDKLIDCHTKSTWKEPPSTCVVQGVNRVWPFEPNKSINNDTNLQ